MIDIPIEELLVKGRFGPLRRGLSKFELGLETYHLCPNGTCYVFPIQFEFLPGNELRSLTVDFVTSRPEASTRIGFTSMQLRLGWLINSLVLESSESYLHEIGAVMIKNSYLKQEWIEFAFPQTESIICFDGNLPSSTVQYVRLVLW
jgi:hypothetical protein